MIVNEPTLHIDLSAVADNYMMLRRACPGDCGATVKANAYGLGVEQITRSLINSGCAHFFVATKQEGVKLRALFPNINIYVFAGLGVGEEEEFIENRLLPVLNTLEQIARWRQTHPLEGAIVHLNTGMNRLGLDPVEADELLRTPSLLDGAGISILMTHLSHADRPDAPQNEKQFQEFSAFAKNFPTLSSSIGNSAGILNGLKFCGDLARPGIALYGGAPWSEKSSPMHPVVRLTAPLLQKRVVKAGETIGYGGLYTAPKDMLVGAVGFGYADGAPRALSKNAVFHIDDAPCKILGRISMDLLMIDLSEHEDNEYAHGHPVELIGKTSLNQFATWADTISYEILTGLGTRVTRRYIA